MAYTDQNNNGQLDDNDRLWIERIERKGNRITVVLNRAVWQGYYRKNFTEAASWFKRVLNINPQDRAAELYLGDSARFMVEGVPEDWEGVHQMEFK